MFIFLDNIGLDVWGGRKDEFDVMKIYLLNKFDDDWGLWNGNKRIH